MRRSDWERIYQARRTGIFARLSQQERLGGVAAENWIKRWAEHAEAEGLAHSTVGFWDAAWEWIP